MQYTQIFHRRGQLSWLAMGTFIRGKSFKVSQIWKLSRMTPSLSCGRERTECPFWAGYPITLFCCKRPAQFLHARVMPQFLLAMNQTKSERQQISELLQSKLRGVQSEVHPTLILGRSQHLPHVPKNHHQTVSRNQPILCRPTRNLHPTANRLGRNQLILYHDTNN